MLLTGKVIALNDGFITTVEFGRIWNEAVMAYLKVIFQYAVLVHTKQISS
jgi:hypothetical protein